MRKIAAFRFGLNDSDLNDLDHLSKVVAKWFEEKGEKTTEQVDDFWLFKTKSDYSKSLYKDENFSSSEGILKRYILREERQEYHLRTVIELSKSEGSNVTTYIQIEYENVLPGIPSRLTIKKPKLISDIISAFPNKLTEIPSKPFDFYEESGLGEYLKLFFNQRNHPLVVLSHCDDSEQDWSELLMNQLAFDLAGTAYVCRIDPEIAWQISETAGNQWSCFNGGVRVFWPDPKKNKYPYHHPLWTADKIRRRGKDVKSIAESVCVMLRKRLIMDLSPFSVTTPKMNLLIQKKSQEELFESRIKEIRGQTQDASVYEEMLKEYEQELENYKTQLRGRENDIAILQYELEELNKKSLSEIAEPQNQSDKDLRDVVKEAISKFSSSILFADKIDKSLDTLARDAGPPFKVYEYLEKLDVLADDLVAAGNKGIGITLLKWLTKNGVKCSGESDTTKRSPRYKETRTFKVDGEEVLFDKHMKLGDAYDIKHCVRIYFDWDSVKQKFLIGYIGEHLE
ncbi:MAG: OmpH family outer membrane protein [Cyclobacteriaceae bacterium]|tara:strand:+ start:66 stop:1598 length:1533 start_codon:yes stop_codon:yes gene_type:complete